MSDLVIFGLISKIKFNIITIFFAFYTGIIVAICILTKEFSLRSILTFVIFFLLLALGIGYSIHVRKEDK